MSMFDFLLLFSLLNYRFKRVQMIKKPCHSNRSHEENVKLKEADLKGRRSLAIANEVKWGRG